MYVCVDRGGYVTGQLTGISSFLLHMSYTDLTQVVTLVGKCLYALSLSPAPSESFSVFLRCWNFEN